MSLTLHELQQELSSLPEPARSRLQRHTEELSQNRPLRVVFLGGFSVGKSSVLNALLKDPLLPVGEEEVTAVPTLLSCQPTGALSFELCQLGHEPLPLSRERFHELVRGEVPLSEAPELAQLKAQRFEERGEESGENSGEERGESEDEEALRYLSVSSPCTWLNGLELFDLPGLSGNDPERAAFTKAQVQSADVVVYLLFPKGPQREDIELINYVQAQGKTLKVCVAQWDKAEQAASERGERLPSLSRWAEQLNEMTQGLNTNLNAQAEGLALHTLSARTGAGLDELTAWLSQLPQTRAQVRLSRLKATLSPLVDQELTKVSEARDALEVEGEAQLQALHEQLMSAERALVSQQGALSAQRSERWLKLQQQVEELQQADVSRLQRQLDARRVQWSQEGVDQLEARWSTYLNEALALRQSALTAHIERLNQLQQTQLDVSELFDTGAFSLKPPQPPALSLDESLALAQIERMRMEAAQLQEALERSAQEGDAQREEEGALITQQHHAINEQIESLQAQQRALLDEPIPMIEEPGSQTGRMIGRMIGEVADVALMVFQPQMVAAKVGSVAGKLGMSAKTLNTIQRHAKVAGKVLRSNTLTQGDNATPRAVPQVLQKMSGVMSALSVSYWAEKIGGMFDQPPIIKVDEQAHSTLKRQRAEVSASLDRLFQQKLDLEQSAGSGSEFAQRDRAQALERVQQEITRLEERLKRERAEEEAYVKQQATQLLVRRLEQLSTQSVLRFQAELRGAERALRESFKAYWDEELNDALQEQRADLETLKALSRQSPAERKERAQTLIKTTQALEALRVVLSR